MRGHIHKRVRTNRGGKTTTLWYVVPWIDQGRLHLEPRAFLCGGSQLLADVDHSGCDRVAPDRNLLPCAYPADVGVNAGLASFPRPDRYVERDADLRYLVAKAHRELDDRFGGWSRPSVDRFSYARLPVFDAL